MGSPANDRRGTHVADDLTRYPATHVAPDEVGDGPSDLVVGPTGRSKRNQDAEELRVLHIEDRRPAT